MYVLICFFPSMLEINMFFHQMFWQQKQLPDTSEGVKIWSWQRMILMIDMIMDTAPEYNKTGLVGFPINVILNWPMATTAGFAAFLNDKVRNIRCSPAPCPLSYAWSNITEY
jgi:hypothetical protein